MAAARGPRHTARSGSLDRSIAIGASLARRVRRGRVATLRQRAGEEFHVLLEHANSPAPGLNEDVVRGIIDVRVRRAYATILSAVTSTCEAITGQRVPILLHGYDRPVPDGRGVAGGWPLPGPWLRPGFHRKGHMFLSRNTRTIGTLIDRFNDMLAGLTAVQQFRHVRYVDLRGTLPNGATFEEWWANELHPTKKGFKAVADRFAAVLTSLP